jgi:flagellar biosynthetic protein FliR
MPVLESFLLTQFAAFTLVLARVGGLIMTAPIFGVKAAPVQMRGLLALSVSLLVTPLFSAHTAADVTNLLAFSKYVLNEALVGILLGLGVMFLLSGIQLSGQIISQLGGTAVAEGYDPMSEENTPVYSQLFYFLALAMFVLVDGHRLLLAALLDTYQWLPLGEAMFGESFVVALTTLLGQSFILGIRAAAPAMIALMLATVILGLIGRTIPQMNILNVGFSVNALLTIAAVFVSLSAIAWTFPEQTIAAIDLTTDAIQEAAAVADQITATSRSDPPNVLAAVR